VINEFQKPQKYQEHYNACSQNIKADLLRIDRMLQKLIVIGPGLRATSQASKIRRVLR
jgi:hypothetical protein